MNNIRKYLWMFAFFFYVVMDLSTTFVGMSYDSVTEANALILPAYQSGNYVVLAAYKVGIFALIYFMDGIIRFVENQFLEGYPIPIIPFVVMYAGMEVTINNINTLLMANASIEEFVISTIAILLPVYLGIKIFRIQFNRDVIPN